MKLRTRFLLFTILLHTILIILAFNLLNQDKYLFVLSEALIIVSIYLSTRLYLAFIRPINLISSGIESLKDKDFNTKFVETGQAEMDQLIHVYNQMADQLREERTAQQEQHFFLERLINASPSGIIILDFEDRVMLVNPAVQRLLNLEPGKITGKKIDELPGKFGSQIARLEKGQAILISINGVEAYKCQKGHFVDRGFEHSFIMIEELTKQLLKTEKRAYDKVIRMMSHEINNSIGAINSILHSVLNYKDQLIKGNRDDYGQAIEVAIERNIRLNRFMANFAEVVRIPQPLKEKTDLHPLLNHVLILMKPNIEQQGIRLDLNLHADSFIVEMDKQQMEQVLLNIIKNAIEACPENGRIIIETVKHPFPQISILNSGPPISEEVQAKLFTPFFSTKQEGQGIGLTLTREILINHEFHFALESNRDGFTQFRIEF